MLPKHTLCGSISWASAHTRSKFASVGGSVKADLAAHGFDELRGPLRHPPAPAVDEEDGETVHERPGSEGELESIALGEQSLLLAIHDALHEEVVHGARGGL